MVQCTSFAKCDISHLIPCFLLNKDDLCSCFSLGICHPSLWMACCCPIILLGQVMHRLKLTCLATEGGTPQQTSTTFRKMFILGILYFVIRALVSSLQVLQVLAATEENGEAGAEAGAGAAMYIPILNYLGLGIVIFYLVLMCRTRRHIRDKYHIPEDGQCSGIEDCCCVYWCTCCTIAQMARHTGDYEARGARCCSETGLGPSSASNDGLVFHPVTPTPSAPRMTELHYMDEA
jgi:Cys-rich protein (TIGR01571 family)